MKRTGFTVLIVFTTHWLFAQTVRHVLFLGNSYTYVNNLPQLITNVAADHGDSLIFDSNAPGGYTLQLHSTNPTSLAKIAQGGWDYVVLQEQSQLPSFDPAQVATDVLPYAHALDSLIHAADSCAESLFYMTWGRKNGDASNCPFYPPVCTYSGMQERLCESYLLMAQQNNSIAAPVGAAWREVRATNPLFDLYQSDESHPSIYGSYLAACVFYEMLFQKSVLQTFYTNTLSLADAQLIQNTVHAIIQDSLSQWAGYGNVPYASFIKNQNGTSVQFNNTSLGATDYSWSFGDGVTSSVVNPNHAYGMNGVYTVTLTANTNCRSSIFIDSVIIASSAIQNNAGISLQIIYSDNQLTIENALPGFYNLKVVDYSGKVILNRSLNIAGSSKVSAHFAQGIYGVKMIDIKSAAVYKNKLLVK